MCVFSMILKYRTLYSKSKMSLNRGKIAHEPSQYVHFLVYYVMAKLLLGKKLHTYCIAVFKITVVKIALNTYLD